LSGFDHDGVVSAFTSPGDAMEWIAEE